jgi:beta-glucosidase
VVVLDEKGCDLEGEDRSGFAAATSAASAADVAVVVVGGRSGLQREASVGEARDAMDLRLTGPQQQLVAAVSETGTPTVVVVMSGCAHVLTGVADKAAALLVAWPPGEQGGNALADVLFGRAQPTDRLPVSLPRATGQVPLYHSHRAGGAKSMFYADYTDCAHAPLFAFGHGLAYTSFEHRDLLVAASDTHSGITATVVVANTGQCPGEQVVQLYATDLVASVSRPAIQLIGFARVALEPGQARRVSFLVHPSRLAFYDEEMDFVVEPGEFTFATGASAADLRTRATFELAGTKARYSQRSVVAVRYSVEEPVPA